MCECPQIFPVIGPSADYECVLSAFSRPVPFKADISPRFPEAVVLLAGEREFQEN